MMETGQMTHLITMAQVAYMTQIRRLKTLQRLTTSGLTKNGPTIIPMIYGNMSSGSITMTEITKSINMAWIWIN